MKTRILFVLSITFLNVLYPQKVEKKSLSPEMIKVEGGTFTMGFVEGRDRILLYNEKKTAHKVTLSSFYISKYEVTLELWESVKGSDAYKYSRANRPKEYISWYAAVEFCNKLSKKEGLNPCYKIDKYTKDPNNESTCDVQEWLVVCDFSANGYRLPTEAEWEYAARGGKKSKSYEYSGSDNFDDVSWCRENSGSETHEVGTKEPNELGIYDMGGNVYEWCWDWYAKYSPGSQTNPKGPSKGKERISRGGNFFDPGGGRVAARGGSNASNSNHRSGMRLVRTKK